MASSTSSKLKSHRGTICSGERALSVFFFIKNHPGGACNALHVDIAGHQRSKSCTRLLEMLLLQSVAYSENCRRTTFIY